jgi:hypothetical protein
MTQTPAEQVVEVIGKFTDLRDLLEEMEENKMFMRKSKQICKMLISQINKDLSILYNLTTPETNKLLATYIDFLNETTKVKIETK